MFFRVLVRKMSSSAKGKRGASSVIADAAPVAAKKSRIAPIFAPGAVNAADDALSSFCGAAWSPAESEQPPSAPASGPTEHPFDSLFHSLFPSAPPSVPLAEALGWPYDASVGVDARRTRVLRAASAATKDAERPVIYAMSRDQRVADNWALLHARAVAAAAHVPLIVVYAFPVDAAKVSATPAATGTATARALGFLLRGLMRVEVDLAQLSIPFYALVGGAPALAALANEVSARSVIVDFSPLRHARETARTLARALHGGAELVEVDAHNIVPAWLASDHVEVGARTLRGKLHSALYSFCTAFPPLAPGNVAFSSELRYIFSRHVARAGMGVAVGTVVARAGAGAGAGADIGYHRMNWPELLSLLKFDASVPEVQWAVAGERAGRDALHRFLSLRLKRYADLRNDPTQTAATSNLSPWLRFGHLSAQRIILELSRATGTGLRGLFPDGGADARKSPASNFAEELVVRRELADNYCLYEPQYDSLAGASAWARDSLALHTSDTREHVYSRADFVAGRTHEALWNSMQMELVHRGKLAGWARMYWAKKVLEWSPTPADALATTIYLNDHFSLDGRGELRQCARARVRATSACDVLPRVPLSNTRYPPLLSSVKTPPASSGACGLSQVCMTWAGLSGPCSARFDT